MERKRAKEFLPLITAYANGAEIQFENGIKWEDCPEPEFCSGVRYRIKKEPHDIKWAAEQLRGGRQVRRQMWREDATHCRLDRIGAVVLFDGSEHVDSWLMRAGDILADDWELYEPN